MFTVKCIVCQLVTRIACCWAVFAWLDGTAPYFTVIVPPRSTSNTASPLSDDEIREAVADWDAIKTAASTAILVRVCLFVVACDSISCYCHAPACSQNNGGTCTHHHAVGKDHRAFYEAEVGQLYVAMLQAVKSHVDPHRIMNPGVLLPLLPEPGLHAAMSKL